MGRRIAVYYGSMSLYISILHNVFLLYHIQTFVSIYKIDKTSFWIGESVFLVWNSINDPLFGWMSDRSTLYRNTASTKDIVLKRISSLKWNGPLLSISFLSFWILWTYPFLQFLICLCLYDTFLTMVDLHHSSLLADLGVCVNTRTLYNSYCSVFSALGSFSVFISYAFWSRDNLQQFSLLCLFLSIFSFCGFIISAHLLTKAYKSVKKDENIHRDTVPLNDKQSSGRTQFLNERQALKEFIRSLAGHKNFVAFAFMNLIQVFHCHFNSNFFPLFLESLLGNSISQTTCSIILGVSFIAPHINNLYFLWLCRRFGVYAVISGLFCLKLLLSVIMLLAGPAHVYLLAFYIASNRVFTEGTCKLLSLVISDLVDEDYVMHGRPQALSALMFGTTALISKPGQTLAPLLGTWLITVQTGEDVFEKGATIGEARLDMTRVTQHDDATFRLAVFQILVCVPIVCAILQLLAWSKFSLRGQRLSWVKSIRTGTRLSFV